MKRFLMMLVLLISLVVSGQAQDKLKVGEVKNGSLEITNLDVLRAFLVYNLDKSGTLGSSYQLSMAPEGDRFFVHYPVSGNRNNVTSIGVMLVKIKNEVFIIENPPEPAPGVPAAPVGPGGGGSVTVTCTGITCNSCYPDVTWPPGNWIPIVTCKCYEPGGTCTMSISFTVGINVGF